MSALDLATAVRTRAGVANAECYVCDVYLEVVPGTSVSDALAAFRVHHPPTAELVHSRRLPAGWRVPLSGPGALSQ